MLKVRAEKDFLAGVLYVILAIGFLWFGQDYKMGAASRMGPGYFPLTLSWVLLIFGAVSIVRAFLSDGEPVDSPVVAYLVLMLPGIMAVLGRRYDNHAFPAGLEWLLLALGFSAVVWHIRQSDTRALIRAIRPLAMVSFGCIAFGWLLPRAGLVFALPAIVLLSAMASTKSEYDSKGVLVLAGLVLFCILAFVKGLGVPMPIFGAWFDGLVPSWLQR